MNENNSNENNLYNNDTRNDIVYEKADNLNEKQNITHSTDNQPQILSQQPMPPFPPKEIYQGEQKTQNIPQNLIYKNTNEKRNDESVVSMVLGISSQSSSSSGQTPIQPSSPIPPGMYQGGQAVPPQASPIQGAYQNGNIPHMPPMPPMQPIQQGAYQNNQNIPPMQQGAYQNGNIPHMPPMQPMQQGAYQNNQNISPNAPYNKQRNVKAVVSMVLGISSITVCCGCSAILGIPGIILGILSLKDNREKDDRAMAIAGIITSSIGILIFLGCRFIYMFELFLGMGYYY